MRNFNKMRGIKLRRLNSDHVPYPLTDIKKFNLRQVSDSNELIIFIHQLVQSLHNRIISSNFQESGRKIGFNKIKKDTITIGDRP